MDKKVIILVVGLVFLISGIGYWSVKDGQKKNSESQKNDIQDSASKINQDPNSEIILFYGSECPHCKDLEKFIEDNKIGEKVAFANLEVWHNKENANVIMEKAKICQISEEELGVPLLFARGKCLVGTPDIEAFFKKEAGMETVDNSGE